MSILVDEFKTETFDGFQVEMTVTDQNELADFFVQGYIKNRLRYTVDGKQKAFELLHEISVLTVDELRQKLTM